MFFVRPLNRNMAAANKRIHSILISLTLLLLSVFVGQAILRILGIEGFNPFQQFYQQFLQAQKQQTSYNDWVGYTYRTSTTSQTAAVLNDLKRRVFQDSCEFRNDWPTNMGGMAPQNGASSGIIATTAYQSFIKCLQSGSGSCYNKLEDARRRYMKPGCQFRNPIDVSSPVSVAFK
jgi:hypothetical protein